MKQSRQPSPAAVRCRNIQSLANEPDLEWMNLIRAEYYEMPRLSLTRHHVERLWNLESAVAEFVLVELQRLSILRLTNKGTYVRADRGAA